MDKFRSEGWRPHTLAHGLDGKPLELISYPYQSDDGQVSIIQVREPGRPTTVRETVVENMRLMRVACKHDGLEFPPVIQEGGLPNYFYIDCLRCHRGYHLEWHEDKQVWVSDRHLTLIIRPFMTPELTMRATVGNTSAGIEEISPLGTIIRFSGLTARWDMLRKAYVYKHNIVELGGEPIKREA